MKTRITKVLFFQIFIIGNLWSQNFASIGSKWYFPETYAFSPNKGVITYTSIGDTTIQNIQAQIVRKDKRSCFKPEVEYYFYESNDSIFEYDTSNEIFELSFIFNAEVGDKWIINETLGLWADSMECTVDSISYLDLLLIDSLRVQHVTLKSFDFIVADGDTIFR